MDFLCALWLGATVPCVFGLVGLGILRRQTIRKFPKEQRDHLQVMAFTSCPAVGLLIGEVLTRMYFYLHYGAVDNTPLAATDSWPIVFFFASPFLFSLCFLNNAVGLFKSESDATSLARQSDPSDNSPQPPRPA